MNLIILTQEDRLHDNLFAVSGKRRRHIVNILHAKKGDTLQVGLLNGPKGTAVIECLEKDKVILDCTLRQQIPQPQPVIELICALPRPQTLKRVLQSASSMAVSNIHIINANRVEQCYFSASVMSGDSIQSNLLEGLSQGKTTHLPKVTVHPRFRCFFEETLPRRIAGQSSNPAKLVAHVDSETGINSSLLTDKNRVYIAIGPEGGWVPFELETMLARGFTPVTIGQWPLRVENAVVAALAQLDLVAKNSQN